MKGQGDGFDRPPLPESLEEFEDSAPYSKDSTSETTETQPIVLSSVQIVSNSQAQERNGGGLEKEESVKDDVLASDGGRTELQAALVRLTEEGRKREEDLLREQREREVRSRERERLGSE